MDVDRAPASWPRAEISETRFRVSYPPFDDPDLPHVEGLLVGAAEVDITPPPGMPKAGHSKNAQDGVGFRTRLKARVVHLRTGTSSVVLVALDLLAGSALVQHALADAVRDLDVPLPGIFLAATHTHAGPGQYSGSAFYNDWASNRPGFDPGYTAFLVGQLESAVREAVTGRRTGYAAIGATEVRGLTRNRSLGAFVRNEGLADVRTEDQRKYVAIDPRLHLLRVDDQDGPLASFTWFSIHGTGISHHDAAYNADVWAYLNGELADRVEEATGTRPISAAAVASHGDMTPAVRPGMLVYPEAERIGRGIGAHAARLHDELGDDLTGDFTVLAALRQLDTTEDPVVDGISLESPRIGWAKTAGAAENTTPLLHLIPPFKAGWGRRTPRGPHAEKRIAGTERGHARLVARPEAFPTVLPIHLLQLGTVAVVGVPFETTVEAGRRIGDAALQSPLEVETAFVSSLVNDHTDYLTTREEYAAQYYEGASVLFGPNQLAWVAGQARKLAGDLATGTGSTPRARTFDFGVKHYLARPTGLGATRLPGAVRFVEATSTEDAYWEQIWTDVAPGDLVWHEPLVRVDVLRGDTWEPAAYDGRRVDDQGWHLGVLSLGRKHGRYTYVARWYAPPLGSPDQHRFVMLANGRQPEIAGPAFD
ncbi:MAG: neutral/alkaline non-lysosomal ceramidase N-terminal domain-containing protein [Propionibacteriales bacterium]|nr:neutral/alkaline non-lysosomal ceramidase N-terminal domain-containing protein [Propionibacteriales bacterium]